MWFEKVRVTPHNSSVHADLVEDSPLAQGELYYPIIDELSSEFSLIVADITQEVCSLSSTRLTGLKMCAEEKLKSKSTPVTFPSSAEDLMSTLSKYWGFLSFELAELVVNYLHIEELLIRFQKYKKNVRKESSRLLRYCKKKCITPKEPPRCRSMRVTIDVDPHSYSLHFILEAKNFLVHQMRMKIALFAGWCPGSIILHFYILEDDDMKTTVYQLKGHELQLRNMQVVAIEVGGVVVYKDAPREKQSPKAGRLPPREIATSDTETYFLSRTRSMPALAAIADAIKTGESVASKLQGINEAVMTALYEAETLHQQFDDKEIKEVHSIKLAQHDLRVFAEAAYTFLNKVDDMFHCCQSNLMAAAIQGLSCSPPDLKPTCDFMSQFRDSLKEAEVKCLELLEACDKASSSCREVAEVYTRMERDPRDQKERTKRIGGTAAGSLMVGGTAAAVVAGGIGASAVAGVFTFGVGAIVGLAIAAAVSTAVGAAGAAVGVGTAVVTRGIASGFENTEAAFGRIRGEFEGPSGFANEVSKVAAAVHTMQENIAAQVDDINTSIRIGEPQEDVSLIRDALEHLNIVCTESNNSTSKLRDEVKHKMEELKAKLK